MNKNNPKNLLIGVELDGGWKIVELLERTKDDTGGKFSIPYKVQNTNGKKGFLKVFNISHALDTDDIMKSFQELSSDYIFERDLLYKCKNRRLSKIIMPIAHGDIKVPKELSILEKVSYIIFELADGDIRQIHSSSDEIDVAWCLKSLHNIATALKQLHSIEVAHQDLKPSNVLCFMKEIIFKVSDLGRASSKNFPYKFDTYNIPGDKIYAPIELHYGYIHTNEFYRRYGIDLYLLGSLVFFYFAGVSATIAIFSKLGGISKEELIPNSFIRHLPYIREAFFEAVEDLRKIIVEDLRKIIKVKAEELTDEIISIVLELCEPDPNRRGNPVKRKTIQFDLEKYVSKFDRIAKRAYYQI